MPEMPEVQGLVAFLGERAVGRTITRAPYPRSPR